MRIAMVSEHASPLALFVGRDAGRQNLHVGKLAAALVRRGHSVTVYTRRDSDRLHWEQELPSGVKLVNLDAGPPRQIPRDKLLPYIPEFAEQLGRYWVEEPPQVVHGHYWMSGIATIEAVGQMQKHGLPLPAVAQTFHALGVVRRRDHGAEDSSPPEREFLEPWVARSVDRVIATCPDEALELRALGVSQRRISVSPCGVDVARFTPDGPARPRGQRLRLAAIGGLAPREGIDTIISAMALLSASGKRDVELLVVGGASGKDRIASDPEARRLRDHAESLGIRGQVIFTGRVPHDDMPELLRSVDVVVCTPLYEPFGAVPLEAMASGVPVIASTVSGLTETVLNGVTGLLVPPRHPAALAEAISTLHADRTFREALGKAGIARARSRYTWDHLAGHTERLYRIMLDNWEHPEADVAASRSRLRRVGEGAR